MYIMRPMESLTHTLRCLVNINDPYVFPLVNQKALKTLFCFECRCIPDDPHQITSGLMKCKCVRRNQTKMRTCRDNRLLKKIRNTITKCHFHKDGCKWQGPMKHYEAHIWNTCTFAKHACGNCNRHVPWCDMLAHRNSQECKNHHDLEVKCRFDCGYKCQRWFMDVHEFDKCPLMPKRTCSSFGNDNGRPTECVANDIEQLMCSLNNRCNDIFRFKFKYDETNTRCKWVCLQNTLPVQLILTCEPFSNNLNVYVVTCEEIHVESTMETLRNTDVTLRLVNKETKYPDPETRDRKMLLTFCTDGQSHFRYKNSIFFKLNAINVNSLFENGTTQTCYLENSEFDVEFHFEYPNRLTHLFL